MRPNKDASRRLQAVCESQCGFFTAKQAQECGFSAASHTYHVREGNWVREYRGIFRLATFPAGPHPELTRWYLWSMDRAGRAQGVYSHSTALDLYLRPERPPDLHLTVPTSFRRSGATPEGLELHYADLPGSDIDIRKGYRLTTPLRTILDLSATEWMPRADVSAALMEMADLRLITRHQIQIANIPEATRQQFEKLLVGWRKRRRVRKAG